MTGFAKKALLTIILLYAGMIAYRYLTLPDWRSFNDSSSETVKKENYADAVKKEESERITFAKNYATAFYINLTFPFDRRKLSAEQCDEIIQIYSDSSNFIWGETTPEYFGSIVFYDSVKNPIALIEIDIDGYNKSYPSLSLMKWGTLARPAFYQLKQIIR